MADGLWGGAFCEGSKDPSRAHVTTLSLSQNRRRLRRHALRHHRRRRHHRHR